MKKQLLPYALSAAIAFGGDPSEGFEDTVFATGLIHPTCIAWAPDGSNRLFVSLKGTGVAIVENGSVKSLFATFPELYTASECGVLGLAFDPDYAANHYVYVFVTVSSTEQRIVRFTDTDNVGTQRTTILGNLPTRGTNHDGGALAFGPDGKLYWAIGDLGDKSGVDGNLSSLAAKVGRANKDGTVPIDNPFADGPGGANDYIWATGFRNPFTMTFQPGSGRLWLNVVGSNPGGQTEPNSGPGYEQVFVVNPGDDGGYDDYEGNQPAGARYTMPFVRPMIRPRIQYKTSAVGSPGDVRGITQIGPGDPSGPLVVNTAANHPYRAGQAVIISGTGAYDGSRTVQSVNSLTQFTIPRLANSPEPVLTNTGSIAPLVQGSSITGGCFYISTAFPSAYYGNFFYGDYVGGNVMRAQIDPDGKPQEIDYFVKNAGNVTDIVVGPDGALYYSDIGAGTIHRVAFTGEPGLIVSQAVLSLIEGGSASFTVRLGAPVSEPVTVQIHKTGGGHIELASSAALTFTEQDWDQPQAVALTASADEDGDDESATFLVTAPGMDPVEVSATATDENLPTFVLSTPNVQVREGSAVKFTVSLSQAPAKPMLVRVRPLSGPRRKVAVPRGALMRFTPKNWALPQVVRVRGIQDVNRRDENVRLIVKASGYRPRDVAVFVQDNELSSPAFTSTPRTSTPAGLLYSYDANASGFPTPAFSLVAAPEGMTIEPVSGLMTWMPPTTGSFDITIRATNSRHAVDQSFTLAVVEDQAPSAFIASPHDGATVAGANAEFFGSSSDDYGTYKAEFYVDDVLLWTDLNRDAHYHLNGAHNLFDTTKLSNGPHTLKMRVYDDKEQAGEMTVTVIVSN